MGAVGAHPTRATTEGTASMIGHLPAWREDGACWGSNSDVFFPEKGGDASEARAICERCDVINECRDFAVEGHEDKGVWGNTTERQRRAIRKERRESYA